MQANIRECKFESNRILVEGLTGNYTKCTTEGLAFASQIELPFCSAFKAKRGREIGFSTLFKILLTNVVTAADKFERVTASVDSAQQIRASVAIDFWCRAIGTNAFRRLQPLTERQVEL